MTKLKQLLRGETEYLNFTEFATLAELQTFWQQHKQ